MLENVIKFIKLSNNSYRRIASILSILMMGLGQIYNKQYIKGIFLLAIHAFSIYTAIYRLPYALWGLITLGEKKMHLEKVGGIYQSVMGDHSILLLVEGLITLFILCIIVSIYVLNIKDAYIVGKSREEGIKPNTFVQTIRYITEYRFPQIILSVPMLGIFFFTILPIIFMILLAFTNYTRENMPPAHLVDWHGFKTFLDIFKIKAWSHTFYGVTIWTFIWAVFATLFPFIGGFGIALLVQKKKIKFKKVWRTIFILPFAIPMFVSVLIFRNMFNGQFGPINQYLGYLGISKVPWLTDVMWAKCTVILVNFWLTFPISMLMIIGVLTTISADLYEAADIDGASGFQKLRLITYPIVMKTMAPLLVISFAQNINNFNVIYLLTNGDPAIGDYKFAGGTDILLTWLYKLSMEQGQYNFASVIGIFIFIILSIFTIYRIKQTKSFKEEDIH
ncbi:sugar ABC transporter permease [Bacillus sp. 03113]|uniref:sugar ABC transporter permease n=1 Tax=Bacillus sp. 03113 TaxID=2578211 RepID=UPI001141B04C|nr:sugar ABC transporter permease [Bacillus sp. 03113]